MQKQILIVDDQYGIRVLLNELFQEEGFETHLAANGTQSLSIVKEQRPDLILLDMNLPDMSGIDVLKRIKMIHPNAIVMIMTAYADLEMINETKELGALSCFSKPFDIVDIKENVKRNIKTHHEQKTKEYSKAITA
jgi:two-component system response regulator (stage 0 sporulation protein F)